MENQNEVNFNTASVPIQPRIAFRISALWKFQYSFCSYSTLRAGRIYNGLFNFNTASVPIQLTISLLTCHSEGYFNTASVPIQPATALGLSIYGPNFNTASVPIQRGRSRGQLHGRSFQYSFCSYSTPSDGLIRGIFTIFQYSFCSYSTDMLIAVVK